MKKIIPIILIVVLAGGGVVLVRKRRAAVSEAPIPVPMTYTVQTARPETRSVSQTVSFSALVESMNSATLSSKLSGRIMAVPVEESREVEAGTLLVTIDDQELRSTQASLRSRLVSARRQLAYQETNLERNQALFDAGGLARERLDASEVAHAAALAAVKEIEQSIKSVESQLDYTAIRAPFAGTVGTIFLRAGDLAVPGKPILTLNAPGRKLTFGFVPDSAEIAVGQEVMVEDARIGTVTLLHDDARAGLTVAEVHPEVSLELPVGGYLTVRVVTRSGTGCSVPVSSLLHRDRGVSVMAYQDERFVEQPVTVMARDHAFALVDPCPATPVAVAAEAKLSLLPALDRVRVVPETTHE